MASTRSAEPGGARGKKALPAKVAEYEGFMDRLKGDLRSIQSQQQAAQTKIDSHRDLVKNIQLLESEGQEELRTMVNLGAEFFCQAEIPDTQRLYMDIGLGFHVQFTRAEAINFCETKIKVLEEQATKWVTQASKIKANLKLVGEGIRELMELNPESSATKVGGFSNN